MKKIYLWAAAVFFSYGFNAQVHYSENFESGNGTQWKYTDLDGDKNNFGIYNVSQFYPSMGSKSLMSFSWNNVVLHPDNLATSTPITIPAGVSNVFLDYSVASQPGSYGAEHYAIYVTTTDDSAAILATTPVFEETLPFAGGIDERSVDVSAFAGKTVYLSFRHFNSVDQYFLALDDLTLVTKSNNDAKLASVKVDKFIKANVDNQVKYTVKNVGSNAITSVELNWNDGTDHKSTVAINIQPGKSADIVHPIKMNYSDVSDKNITASISLVNTAADANPADNSTEFSTTVVSQAIPKKVVFEEGTGTWCGWCPRGMVALAKVNQDYPDDQISIAVHNGDPMVLGAYDNGANFSGFPGMNVDRELKGEDPNPNTINNYVTSRKSFVTPVLLDGEYTIDGSTLTVNASAQFFSNISNANYRIAAIVVEDGVKGTGIGYRQANYYANNAQGPMGGFESLPSYVPAAQMTYDHVGRALLGGYDGQADSVPTTLTDQQVVNYTFTYTIPEKYNATTNAANDVVPNPDNMHVVLLLVDQNDKTIVNAAKLKRGSLAVENVSLAKSATIYPNPAKTDFNIRFAKDGKYNVVIYDMSGKIVANYGTVSTSSKSANLPIKLLPGKYLVNISQNGVSYSKELLVK